MQSHRFSGRLAYGEGISERNPVSTIDQHRRRSPLGRCWAAADRSSAAKGDSESNVFSRREESSLIHGVRRHVGLRLVARLKWCRMAVNDAFAAWVAGYRSHSPEVLHFGSFGRSARIAGRTSLTQQISHNRPAADGQHQCGKVSSQGEYSESSMHQAVLPTVGLAKRSFGYDCEQLHLALGHSEELFPTLRTPTSLMVQVKN